MELFEKVENAARRCGFHEFGYVKIDNLKFDPSVRKICEGNGCRGYAASWACPPAVGTLEECREQVRQYDKMLLLAQKYELEDSFDFESMSAGMRDFKDLTDQFHRELDGILPSFLLLSNEGCGRCVKCTYPGGPCRFPKLLHHSLEGYGFIVKDLADEANMRYHNGPNTVTYFGALFFSL